MNEVKLINLFKLGQILAYKINEIEILKIINIENKDIKEDIKDTIIKNNIDKKYLNLINSCNINNINEIKKGFYSKDVDINKVLSIKEVGEKYRISYGKIKESIGRGYFIYNNIKIIISEYDDYDAEKNENELKIYKRYGNIYLINEEIFRQIFKENHIYRNQNDIIAFENIITSIEITSLFKKNIKLIKEKIYNNNSISRKVGGIWIVKRKDFFRIMKQNDGLE